MGQIKFTVPDDVEQRFRKQAMEAFGYKQGATSKAAEQALQQWAAQMEALDGEIFQPDDPIDAIHGLLSHIDTDSVRLQKEIGKQRYNAYRDARKKSNDS